jgi:putative transport protein
MDMTTLDSNSYFILFFIIALGLAVGQIKIGGISLEASAVIFIAILFGHLGYQAPAEVQTIGLLLFIFTIGIQAGPGFFDSFRKKEFSLFIPPLLIIFVAAVFTAILALLFKLDMALACGLFTGALTSTPGLAAAVEVTRSPLTSLGYGIAYPMAVISVILFVRLLPRLLHVDLLQAQDQYQTGLLQAYPEILNKNFMVVNINVDGKSIGDLNLRRMTSATLSRVLHEGKAVTPTAQTRLHIGDLVKAVGTAEALENVRLLIGRPTEKAIPLSQGYDVQWILVTNKKVINKSLAELNLLANFNATVTRIRRSEVDITPQPHSVLRFGDKLMIASDLDNMEQVAELLGNNVKKLSETDFLPIFVGITAGILLGRWHIPLPGGMHFQLGLTGGVLTAALLLSRIGKTGPIIWSLSGTGNQVLRQLGLLLFLACVGTEAGQHLDQTITATGLAMAGIGIIITLVPMILATWIAVRLVKLNFLSFLGALTGGMTSTPGLAAIDSMSDCAAPHIAYATVYPLALVFKILCVRLLALFLS